MKNIKKILFTLIAVLVMVAMYGCGEGGSAFLHTHDYKYEVTKYPTMTEVGSAIGTCECKEVKNFEIPVLTDTSVWTVKESIEATHKATGSTTFTSKYGEVTVTLEIIPHSFGAWEVTSEPTMDEAGSAERECSCGELETVVLPVLSDSTFWEITEDSDSTHKVKGQTVYTSKYVVITIEKELIPHGFGAWAIALAPTMEAEGRAEKECECGQKESFTLPVLSDTSFWSVKASQDATHSAKGFVTYESTYGEVTVEIPEIAHSFGDWTWVTEPTMEASGKAERVCDCTAKEEQVVPALTDESWSSDVTKATSYNEAGVRTYTCAYGSVEQAIAKLVAPYDSKTYVCVEIYDSTSAVYNCQKATVYSWSTASVTLDEKAEGTATAFPFRGENKVTMVNAETGEVKWVVGTSTYYGYVDFATGVVAVKKDASFEGMYVFLPQETYTASGSIWANVNYASIVTQTKTYNIMAYKEVVYFGVTLVDAEGQAIAADAAYNAPFVKAMYAGKELASFAKVEGKLVELDGKQGTYVAGTDSYVVTGYGVIELGAVKGTYEFVSEAKAEVFLDGSYYEMTFDFENMTVSVEKPMVTITFVTEYGTQAPMSVNKKVEVELPELTDADHAFKGWYLEAGLVNKAENFAPEADTTLYASWKNKVLINLSGVLEGDATTLLLGEGDVIGDFLPEYTYNKDKTKVFKGWFLSAEFTEENALPEEAVVTEADSNITIYAKWVDMPAYVGSYTGSEIYNGGFGNYGGNTLVIDEEGNMTGLKSGKISSYDEATGLITFVSGSTTYKFWFEPTTRFIAGLYTNNKIGNDYYALSQYGATNGKYESFYGVYCPVAKGWEAQFITVKNAEGGSVELFMYNNTIYANPIIKNTNGQVVAVSAIKDQKTIVVSDKDGNFIFAAATSAENFSKGNTSSTNKALDSFYGTYVSGDDTVVFDGTGIATVNGKVGTYAKVEGQSYGFDVYADGVYYEFTIVTATTGSLVKPMVTITYEVPQGHNTIASQSVNKNIAVTLADGTEAGYVFNGWYLEEAYTNKVEDGYVPTADVTLYAKYSAPAVMTVHFNDGATANAVTTYSVGDTVTVENPKYTGFKFEGWFTSSTFEAGSEWVSGSTISADTDIYAKWSEAPKYNQSYYFMYINGTNANGSTSSLDDRSPIIAIDPDGYAKDPGTYPFYRYNLYVQNYDATTNTGVIFMDYVGTSSSSTDEYHDFYLDPVSKFMIVNKAKGASQDWAEVWFLQQCKASSTAKSSVSSSYWNSGKTRCIEYTYDTDKVFRAFIDGNQVYFGVTFTTLSGTSVLGNACYNSETLVVKQGETVLGTYGYNGTTMVALDGYQGTYTFGTHSLVLNGNNGFVYDETISGTYEIEEGTLAITLTEIVEGKVAGIYKSSITAQKELVAEPVLQTVTFTYVCGDVTSKEAEVVRVGVEKELEVLSVEGYAFKGWFTEATFENQVEKVTPSESMTYYAKFVTGVKVTYVVGNEMENVEVVVGVGEVATAPTLGFANMMEFKGWFLEDTFDTAYDATQAVNASITVYAKWEQGKPYQINTDSTYAFAYSETDGWYVSTNQGKGSSTSWLILDIYADCTITFEYKVSSEANWDYASLLVLPAGGGKTVYTFGSDRYSGKSGIVDWTSVSVTVKAGDTIKFCYTKDSSGNGNSDTAWVRNIDVE